LTTRLGRTIRATANHKFRSFHGWKRLDELTVGEHLALPRQIPQPQAVANTMHSAELGLLGHLIGDGCTLPRHAIQYTTNDFALAGTVTALAAITFGKSVNSRIKRERNWYQVYLPASFHLTHGKRTPVAVWLDNLGAFGFRSYEKFVPQEVFSQSLDNIGWFLRHLWSTDGCIRILKNNHYPAIYYASSSARLSYDTQSLLLRFGINAKVYRVSQNGKGRDQYHTIVSGRSDIVGFLEQIGTIGMQKSTHGDELLKLLGTSPTNTNRDIIPASIWTQTILPVIRDKKISGRNFSTQIKTAYSGTSLYTQNISRDRAQRIANVLQDKTVSALAQSDIYWDQVASIEPDGIEEVFDLTVAKHHNFVANNIIVHNSIEQDADVVMFIHRKDMYKDRETQATNIADIYIKKHRNGAVGDLSLYFDGEKASFRNLDQSFTISPQAVMESLNNQNTPL
jgi:replicative DNA helicase